MAIFKFTKLSQGQNMINFSFGEYHTVFKESGKKELLVTVVWKTERKISKG
jgi:hypothetical protein